MKKTTSKLNKLLTGALVLGTSVLGVATPALAGDFTTASVLLSDSRPSQTGVTYTFSLRTGTTTTIRCIDIKFQNTPTSGTPIGLSASGASLGTVVGITGWSIGAQDASSVTLTNSTGESVSTSTAITIPLLDMVNPSAEQTTPANGPYYAKITSYTNVNCTDGKTDSSVIAFKVQPGVTVSATVDPTFTMAVAGIASSTAFKGALNTSNCTTTATVITFPTSMVPDQDYTCAQSITIVTNANAGYTVTMRGNQSANFMRSTSSSITDWTGTNAAPSAWPATPDSEAFGYTTSDADLATGTVGRFSGDDTWAAVSTTAAEIAYHGSSASETKNIGYRLRFRSSTKAGNYTGQLVYVGTPTF